MARGSRPPDTSGGPGSRRLCVVDTNVVVSGLIDGDSDRPPARILDAMIGGRLLYMISPALLSEYSAVLCRPAIAERHGLTPDELDRFLADLVANAVWREPDAAGDAPDIGDNHLWDLLASERRAQLITGDRLLLRTPPSGASVVSPRQFVEAFLLRDSR